MEEAKEKKSHINQIFNLLNFLKSEDKDQRSNPSSHNNKLFPTFAKLAKLNKHLIIETQFFVSCKTAGFNLLMSFELRVLIET